eukprot:SAG22_NODE_3844_length_1505_cov_2.236842_1_plen_334_part_10
MCCALPLLLIQVFKTGRRLESNQPELRASGNFTDIQFVRQVLMIFCFLGGLLYLPALQRAIQPETGTLVMLGAGSKLVPARQVRSLQLWKKIMLVPTFVIVLWSLFTLYVFSVMLLHFVGISPLTGEGAVAMDAWSFFMPVMPFMMGSLLIGWPAGFCWYASLKVAVVLSRGDVQAVVECVEPAALRDDAAWCTKIARPSIRLATHTMPHLSQFGDGVGLAALICLTGSVASFIGVVHAILFPEQLGMGSAEEEGSDPIEDGGTGMARKILAMVGRALAPVLLAKDVADVSSLCDVLVNVLNELRLEWSTTAGAQEVHNRTYPLQMTLERLNGG